jgi:lipopolysaccharide transport system ATP-binding protein
MYMRLAFAVAAHLEPEILIVDEVLAVGDAQFQKKCLGKMSDVAKGGRTVLFVTHNMAAVTQLCDEGLLLENGTVRARASAEDAVAAYMSIGTDSTGDLDLREHVERTGTSEVRFTRARLENERGEVATDYCLGETVSLVFDIESLNCPGSLTISIGIVSTDGLVISNAVAGDSDFEVPREPGVQQFRVRFHDVRLYPGRYFVSLWAGSVTGTVTYDWIERVTAFNVVGGGKLAIRPLPKGSGLVFLTPEWESVAQGERCA